MKSIIFFLSFVLAGGAFAFWNAGVLPRIGEQKKASQLLTPVKESAPVICGVGYVEPTSEIRKLTFKIDGVIAACRVQVGQSIKAGDLICALRNTDEHSNVVVAEQELALAKADRIKLLSGVHPSELEAAKRRISALEVKWKFYEQRFQRESSLVQQRVTTQETLEQVTSELSETIEKLKEARAELNRLETFVRNEDRVVADARVDLAVANLAAAKTRFQETLLRAPFDGTVLEILKREGEAVRVYDPTPVLVFADITKLRVRAEFDERFVNDIRIGQKAKLFGRGTRDRSMAGSVKLMKTIMGKKTVFSRESAERKDLEVLQVFVEPEEPINFPIGLKIDVQLEAADPMKEMSSDVVETFPSRELGSKSPK